MKVRLTRHFSLLLVGVLALAGVSPLSLRSWSYANEQILPLPFTESGTLLLTPQQADLDGDGSEESLTQQDGRAGIHSQGRVLWSSPESWQVTQARLTDLNRDGKPEVTLLVWRPFQPWPIDRFVPHGGRIASFQDADGRSCHLILIGWEQGDYRELWAGSALAQPLLDFTAADLDGDGRQELAVLESDYTASPTAAAAALSVWEWNGFGFTILDRTPGPFYHLDLLLTSTGQVRLVTRE